jgi:von Willebrand factor type A domain
MKSHPPCALPQALQVRAPAILACLSLCLVLGCSSSDSADPHDVTASDASAAGDAIDVTLPDAQPVPDAEAGPVFDAGSVGHDVGEVGCGVQVEPIETNVVPPPLMMLVVDRSASMSGSKWTTMKGAVQDIVDAYSGAIQFGLIPFPVDALCAVDVAAPISPNNESAIAQGLSSEPDIGGTPTAQALDQARGYLASFSGQDTKRYVLLATDGEPTCGDSPDGYATQMAAADLHASGVDMFVLGFHFDSAPLLGALAEYGGTGDYYTADSPSSLFAQLDKIAAKVQVPPCTYELQSVPEDHELLTVLFDGVPVGLSESRTNGWNYDSDSNTIAFYGDACVQLQSGDVEELRVEFGCPGPVVK